jgi:hypothetical protein
MGEACGMRGEIIVIGQREGKEDMGDLRVKGRILFNLIL